LDQEKTQMFRTLGKSLVSAAVLFAAAPLVLAQISGTGSSGQTGTGAAGPGNTGMRTGNMETLPERLAEIHLEKSMTDLR
jgi:hypothetical protein